MNVWPLPKISFRALNTIDESRPTALITDAAAWESVGKAVKNLPLVIQAEPTRDDYDFVEYLATNLPKPVQVVYAVGDGLVIDIAKVVASINSKPLIIVTTAISSDAAFSPTATVRENDKPSNEDTGPAAEVVIDMDLIKSAAAGVRAAGIVDVLSIVTGLMDWGYAAQKNKTTPETKLSPWAMGVAAGLAAQALKSAVALGKGDPDALRLLIDLLCMTIQMDNQLGHRRASQGLEHAFAMSVKADPSIPHAEKVGPGILLASAFYAKDTASMRTALEAAGVKLDSLKPEDIRAAANALPDYVKQNDVPYSLANDLNASSPETQLALDKSTLNAAK